MGVDLWGGFSLSTTSVRWATVGAMDFGLVLGRSPFNRVVWVLALSCGCLSHWSSAGFRVGSGAEA